jgi:hypothetical protein
MSRVHVFTSAAFNYIPKARLLFGALRNYHPEWVLHLALGDEPHPEFRLADEPFDEIMPIAELGIPDWRGWAFCHSIVELCTAIKPFALQQLLRREGCEKVLYFDPDIVAFSRLDDLLATLDDANVVLTPHLADPETDLQAVIDNEICSLRHGVYNLGFIGVRGSDEGLRFADWWGRRAYHFCRDDIPNGLFTDQRWIDLVPAFFEGVAIMRSRRHNVAVWNITARDLSGSIETGLSVDGDPLGFYHFTGFDSGAHLGMANKYAGNSPAVFELIKWYEAQTEKQGRDPIAQVHWAYEAFSNGERITPAQRIIYRERVDLQAAFPDPFDAAGYLQWWRTYAPKEYPVLFDRARAADELRRLASALTPGFCAGVRPMQNRTLASRWSAMRASPIRTIRRGWEILRTGGAGVRVHGRGGA